MPALRKQHICDWADFDSLSALQRRRALEDAARPSSPFSLLSIPSTRAEQLRCAKNFARYTSWPSRASGRNFSSSGARGTACASAISPADFHEHATAYLTAELFELHDRRRFEVLAYSYGPDDGSPMRARLMRAFDRFTDIEPLSHAAAAAKIYADGVDILVDLKGYTEHARTRIVALRPAPVQVNYIGYPGTMGAEFIDYLVADRFVVPSGHAADYSEQLALLPGSYQANDRSGRSRKRRRAVNSDYRRTASYSAVSTRRTRSCRTCSQHGCVFSRPCPPACCGCSTAIPGRTGTCAGSPQPRHRSAAPGVRAPASPGPAPWQDAGRGSVPRYAASATRTPPRATRFGRGCRC